MWADSIKFLQWHSSVGLFQLSFSSGVLMYPASICLVAQWYLSVQWVNQWHSSGTPVYTGPASVHWLRVRVVMNWHIGRLCYMSLLSHSSSPINEVIVLCLASGISAVVTNWHMGRLQDMSLLSHIDFFPKNTLSSYTIVDHENKTWGHFF